MEGLDALEGSRRGLCAHGEVFDASSPMEDRLSSNQEEAAELLGVSERTLRRGTRRYQRGGRNTGLIDLKARHRRRAGGFRQIGRKKWSSSIASTLPGFYRSKHFPEHPGEGPGQFRLGLHLVEAASAMERRCCEGAARGKPVAPTTRKARAAAAAGHDAAPGRLALRMARGPARP